VTAHRTSDSCLMLDYVHLIDFRIIIIIIIIIKWISQPVLSETWTSLNCTPCYVASEINVLLLLLLLLFTD